MYEASKRNGHEPVMIMKIDLLKKRAGLQRELSTLKTLNSPFLMKYRDGMENDSELWVGILTMLDAVDCDG